MVGLGGESQANEPCLRMICPDTWVETKLKPPSFLDVLRMLRRAKYEVACEIGMASITPQNDSTCGSMRVRHVPVIIISIHVV